MPDLPSIAPRHAASETLRLAFPSRILNRDWDYAVYLPTGYAKSRRRYPIAYFLHGANGAAGDYLEQGNLRAIADRMIKAREIPRSIIVTPSGYESWYINRDPVMMQDAFFDEFIPYIETTLRVIGTRETRVIGGLSMGGYGALRFALLRPDLFSAASLMSPAVYADAPAEGSSAWLDPAFDRPDPDGKSVFDPTAWTSSNYPTLIDAYLAKNQPIRFHIAAGDRDAFGIDDHALRLYRFLRDRDQRAKFCLAPGGHDWQTWTAALDDALRFALAVAT